MRILWIAPWGRPLARVYLDELVREGHEVRLVTSTRHHEKWADQADYELVLSGSFKQPESWPSFARTLREVRRFRPEVAVGEEFNDPRLLTLLGSIPHVTLMHDDAPHDPSEVDRWYHQAVYKRVARTSAMLVTFSDFVRTAIAPRSSTPVVAVPLPSDAGEHHVPPFVPAEGRRDIVLIGRINPYKNLPGVFDAWVQHVESPAYRGDRLIVIGDGAQDDLALPPECEWRRGHFQFSDLMPVVGAAKASLVYYTKASQSGVQVLSMQCGTVPVVSDIGGLPDYQPVGEPPVPLGAHDKLAAVLGELADPEVAGARGMAARKHYEERHLPAPAAHAMLDVLERVRLRGRGR